MLKHGNKDRKHKDLKTLSSKGETFMGGAIVILAPLEVASRVELNLMLRGCHKGSWSGCWKQFPQLFLPTRPSTVDSKQFSKTASNGSWSRAAAFMENF